MTIPLSDMSGRRHNSSVQKSFQSTEAEKNKTSEDTLLYEGKERELSRSNLAINKDGRFLPEILREGTILDMQALLQEESARGTAEATVGKRRKTRKKKKDKKSKNLHKGVGEHRSEVTENDEQFEVELTEEEKERDKLFRRITRTLPTHLLLKAHERENQAGADMSAATKKQQLLQRMKDSSSSGEVLKDPRFTNILRALSHNKL
ncbi:uncharacterized protein [Ptychodera flava]|uniref:uncharacterized protein isoform X2 n=1 Tax=Ptychodera flava TaxID=63121 RepID=UPI003969DAB7